MQDPGHNKPERMDGEIAASVYYSNHDLREMFSRENAERRRSGAKMLRKHLSAKQDKQVLNKLVRIRDEYAVSNNDDLIIVWAQQMVEEGKGEEVPKEIMEVAVRTVIPRRTVPFDETITH